MEMSVPDKARPEWRKIINGEIDYQYQNYVLQTKIHRLRKDVLNERKTEHEAIDDLYALCSKYALAVRADFKQIFKNW